MSDDTFLVLPPFTPDEGRALLSAIDETMDRLHDARRIVAAPEPTSLAAHDKQQESLVNIDRRLGVLWSLRTAFAESVANHR